MEADKRDAETRRNSVRSLITLAETVQFPFLSPDIVQLLFKTFLDATNDYSTDNRGDVGSWVREWGMIALERMVKLVCTEDERRKGG